MSISKTRWKIESDRITIQPFGLQFILAGVLGVIFLGLFIVTKALGQTNFGSATIVIFLILVLGLFMLNGFTYIVFDRSAGTMTKLLFGFIPVTRTPLTNYRA